MVDVRLVRLRVATYNSGHKVLLNFYLFYQSRKAGPLDGQVNPRDTYFFRSDNAIEMLA